MQLLVVKSMDTVSFDMLASKSVHLQWYYWESSGDSPDIQVKRDKLEELDKHIITYTEYSSYAMCVIEYINYTKS